MPDFVSVKSSYTGSRLFEPLANRVNFPIDRLNFLIAQALALFLAYLYQRVTSRGRFSYNARLFGALVPGVLLGIFTYGRDTFHIVLLGFLGYAATVMADSRNVHKVTMLIAFLYLSKVHLMRMMYDYEFVAVIDITGPAMIAVQKVTSLAYGVYDGHGRPDEELSDEQRKSAIRRRPSLLEYFSYLFSFQTLMCGPLVYYNDYIDFITEDNFKKNLSSCDKRPSPTAVVTFKLLCSFFFAFMVIVGQPFFPTETLSDDVFLANSSFFIIVLYMMACTTAARFKYYLAWKLGETASNASGLGFCGHDEYGRADWSLLQNIDVWKVETSFNFKVLLDHWNTTTGMWLRRHVYERTKAYRTTATFVVSALWHGFWPGYYITFLTGALITNASRKGRRFVRPLFQANAALRTLYGAVTFLLTRVYIAYVTAPFVLLSLESTLKLYTRLYFFGHFPCFFAIVVFPMLAGLNNASRANGSKISGNGKINAG